MATSRIAREPRSWPEHDAIAMLKNAAEDLPAPEHAEAFGAPFERYGDASVVLLGEASHGTSEFYRARAAITRHLIRNCGFNIIAVESDWPDAARIDRHVRHHAPDPSPSRPLRVFPAGCGAISRCWNSPNGCAAKMRGGRTSTGSNFAAWISTAWKPRSLRCSTISTGWTPMPRRRRERAMAA